MVDNTHTNECGGSQADTLDYCVVHNPTPI